MFTRAASTRAARSSVVACAAACAVAAMLAPWALAAQQPRRPTILSRLVWFDRAGTRLGGVGPAADHGNVELSPDGSRVAVAVAARPGSPRDVWIYNTSSGARTQFTSDSADENWLVWSADGRHVILNSFGPERLDLFEALFSDVNARKTLLSGSDAKWPVSLSRDGRFLLYVTDSRDTNNDIWVMPLRDRVRPYPFLRSEAAENWAAFSPDGKWVAFSSTEGGQPEVYVAAFPPTGRHWRVSADGGSQARWRRDGKEIFYLAPDRTLMAASVTASKRELVVNEYRPLFQVNSPYGAYHAFDVTADGQRFLVNTLVVDPASSGVVASLSSACTRDPASASVAESAKMRGMTGCRPSTPIRGLMP